MVRIEQGRDQNHQKHHKMKKTVSVNIKGTNFLIEEDAYELLQDYLDRLTQALKNDEGNVDIIEDVELRIAEICSSKLSEIKTVIELKDIEEILSALGDPSDFVDEDAEPSSQSTSNNDSKKAYPDYDKRLFRDSESSYLGGVCSGLGNYFGIDPIIVRILFIIFSGIGFPIYIILWIVVPKAESTIDKLRMKGHPITVESVKKEVNEAADNIKTGAKSFKNKIKGETSNKERSARGKRIFTTIIGLGFIGFGIMNLIGFMIFIIGGFEVFPIHGDDGWMSLTDLGELVVSNPSDVSLAWAGGLMIWISAILFTLYIGVLLLFQIKSKWTKFVIAGLIATGITGIIISAVVGMRIAKDFTYEETQPIIVGTSAQKELVIIPQMAQYHSASNDQYYDHDGPMMNFEIGKKNITSYGIDIQYEPSPDTLFHVIQNLSAHSKSKIHALEKADHITHNAELRNDTLYVDVFFTYPKADKLRAQNAAIVIQIPENYTVRYKNRVIHLGAEDEDQSVDHPYYKKQGRIRGDGSYDQYYNEKRRHRIEVVIDEEFDDEFLDEL